MTGGRSRVDDAHVVNRSPKKKWYTSKTLWFNFGSGLVAVGTELAPLIDLLDAEAQATLRTVLVVALAVGNLILRTVTHTGVTR